MAQGISMIAIPWYFAQSGQMSRFAIIYVLSNIISLVWVPYTGTLVDKYNRKNIFLAITTVCGLFLMGITAYGYYYEGLPWQMVGLAFMMTFANYNLHYPTLYAFVQEISERRFYSKISSYIEVQGQLTSVLAGAAAALLLEGTSGGQLNLFGWHIAIPFHIEAWPIHKIFALDAATYLLAFIIIALIRFQPISKRSYESGNLWQQLQVGWQYLKNNNAIFLFGVASYSVFVAVLLTTFYMAALYVSNHLLLPGDVFATAEMYYALGAVFAGLAIRYIFRRTSLPFSVIILSAIGTALYAVLSCTQSVFLFYGMMLLLGISNAGIRVQRITYLFKHIPNQVYGRASSIFFLTNIVFRILLLLLFSLPFFQKDNHVIYALAVISLFLFLSTMVLIRNYQQFLQPEKLPKELNHV